MDQVTHVFDPLSCRYSAEHEAQHLKDKSILFREQESVDQKRAVIKQAERKPDFGEQRYLRLREQFARPKEA